MSIVEEGKALFKRLGKANRAFLERYPGEPDSRQPIHTVYGGAQLFKAETPRKLGELARRALDAHAPDPFELARAVGFLDGSRLAELDVQTICADWERDPETLRQARPEAWLACTVYERVRAKLEREPVEDYRIDFEDGFGARSDQEEDAVAERAARELARAMQTDQLPPFIGIRIKALTEEWKLRAARTLEIFLETLLGETSGRLPEGFVVTLPKVTIAAQPRTLVRLFEMLETRHRLEPGALRCELMIEVSQALLGPKGRSPLPGFLRACQGRCVGAHLGAYDFTASCNVTATEQTMEHPLCDLARGMMTLAYAGTGIFLSDGATNVMPVGPHKGQELSPEQRESNRAAVHAAWQLSHRHIRHSLGSGFYQGWDLHPAQLPARYATVFAFFLSGLPEAGARLRAFIDKAAQATLLADVFDDAATGQGLLNFFLRALNCGALNEPEAAQSGLTREELQLRSFARILAARRERLQSSGA